MQNNSSKQGKLILLAIKMIGEINNCVRSKKTNNVNNIIKLWQLKYIKSVSL